MKKRYVEIQIEIIKFDTEDVIALVMKSNP